MSKVVLQFLVSATLALSALQAPAVEESTVSTKSEPSKDLTFLVGNWSSTDPAVHFSESWCLAGDNQLKGFRVSDPPVEYALFVFELSKSENPGTVPESHVRLRRMTSRLRDLGFVSRPVGEWKLVSANKCLISFEDPTWSMTTEYTSLETNKLDLEIQIKQNNETTTRVFHLHRVSL